MTKTQIRRGIAALGAALLSLSIGALPATADAPTGTTPNHATILPAERHTLRGFVDVPPDHAFYEPITWIHSEGIADGWKDGSFRPLNRISREAMAAFLYRWAGEPDFDVPTDSPFNDVPSDYQFYEEIAWLETLGIAEGWDDGSFRPLNRISREAMAAFLYRYMETGEYTAPEASPFTDVSTEHAFYDAISWLHENEFSHGWEDGTYRPLNRISREATAAFLYRIENNPDDGSDIGAVDGVVMLPEPTGQIGIDIDTLGQALPSSKAEGSLPVMLTIEVGDSVLSMHGTVRVQGSSTARWPKKNWSLKLYANEDRQEPVLLKIGDSVPSDTWVVKADWIDPSQLRNAISYQLWSDMVDARTREPKNDVAWLTSVTGGTVIHDGAQGFPRTHMSRVTENGAHYGVGLLLLGHEPRNFNIDANNPDHTYLEFDARGGAYPDKDWAKFSSAVAESHFENYLTGDATFSQRQLNAINDLGVFINGPLDVFEAQFDQYFDKMNMIDMYLLMEFIHDWDAVAQDIEIVSYDLKKWLFLPWDKDTTFGLGWDGSGLRPGYDELPLFRGSGQNLTTKVPWMKLDEAFSDEIDARYAELRDSGVFSRQHVETVATAFHNTIDHEAWDAEAQRWNSLGRPSVGEVELPQILDWVETRIAFLDSTYNY